MKEFKVIHKNGDSVMVRHSAENASEFMQEINRRRHLSDLHFPSATIYPAQVAEVKELKSP